MRVFVSIVSHAAGASWREAIRETWLREPSVDYRFVLGAGAASEREDELIVDASDAYEGILEKVRRVCEWAYERNYDFVFQCFTDTYVSIPRLLASGFAAHSYSGHIPSQCGEAHLVPLIPDEKGRFAYASGGAGYWLDRRALELVARTEPPAGMQYDDLWIGTLLGLHGIAGFHDPRYGFRGMYLCTREQITVHLSQGTGNFDPEWMYRAHDASLRVLEPA